MLGMLKKNKLHLVYYDSDSPIRLVTDTSSYGFGTVFSHVLKDGTEHLIAYMLQGSYPIVNDVMLK